MEIIAHLLWHIMAHKNVGPTAKSALQPGEIECRVRSYAVPDGAKLEERHAFREESVKLKDADLGSQWTEKDLARACSKKLGINVVVG